MANLVRIIFLLLSVFLLILGCTDVKEKNPSPPAGWNASVQDQEILVPAGEFLFAGKVKTRVDSFFIDKTPVTNRQFKIFCESTNFQPVTKCSFGDPFWNNNGIFAGYEDHPVICIDWDFARRYCKWNGKRLPTEAEWEYTALADKMQKFTWGNKIDRGKLNAVGIDKADLWATTSPVGAFPPNDRGVFDLCGNVWEWCQDNYAPDWLDSMIGAAMEKGEVMDNPKGPDVPTTIRVLKGGSWHNKVGLSAITNRENLRMTSRFRNVGFRCVRDVNHVSLDSVPAQASVSMDSAAVHVPAPK